MELVRVENAEVLYPGDVRLLFEGCFSLRAGETVALLGSNGSGKSTLLRLLAGLLPSVSGKVEVFGLDPHKQFLTVRDGLGVLMQHVEDQLIAPTVAEDIAFTPRNRGWSEKEVQLRLREVFREFELEGLGDRPIHDLSGGEQIKVALAGAMISQPRLLLLDEPFESLDPISREELIHRIRQLSQVGIGVLLSTHQIHLVPETAERVFVLAPGGRFAMQGPVMEILGRSEELRQLGIDPPSLSELFSRLNLPLPRNLEEALAILKPLLNCPSGQEKHRLEPEVNRGRPSSFDKPS